MKNAGFPHYGFNPPGFRSNGNPPYTADALHYSKTPLIGEDRTGISDRTSIMTKKIVGDGATYLEFADFLSETLVYYDLVLDTEVTTATDASGQFILPTNGISYIDVDGHRWVIEEIVDITTQTSLVSTDGLHTAQFYLSDADTVVDDYRALSICDLYGYTLSDGVSIYKEPETINLYALNQPISAKLIGGTYSKQYCKGYDSEGNPYPLEFVGRVKHQIATVEQWGVQWNQATDTMTYTGFDHSQVDFDNIYPYSEMRRCNVADDGIVNAYYGDAGFVEDGSNGQVMVEIPLTYTKYTFDDLTGDRIFAWEFSKYADDGFKIDPAFNLGTGYASHLYVSAYEGSIYDTSASAYLLADEQIADFTAGTGDVLSSIANAKPCSGLTQQLTLPNSRILAQNRGTNWGLLDVTAVNLIQKLLISEYKSFNSQSVIGQGVVNKAIGTGNESELTGGTSSLGNTTGDAGGTDGLTSISYRGIENFWGNIWSWIDGINIQADNELWINPTNQDFVSDSFISPYIDKGTLHNANGYVSNILDTEFGLFATATSGSSSTYLTDYYYQATGNRVAHLGGYWDSGSVAGCACWFFYASSASPYQFVGARCCFRKQSTVEYPKSPIRLEQLYPLIQQADTNDILTEGTVDVKTNRVRAVDDINNIEYQQAYAQKNDDGDLTKYVFYDEAMTDDEAFRIKKYLGLIETAVDSVGDMAVDSEGEIAYAPKTTTTEVE